MQSTSYSAPRGIKAGALGGLIGSIVLGLLAGISALVLGEEIFYVTIARKLGLGDFSLAGAWILHFTVGIIAGAVFIGVTAVMKRLAITSTGRGVWIGLLGGIAVWLIVYVPVTELLVPTDLTNPMFAGGALIFHMIYGIITAIVSLSLIQRTVRQETIVEKRLITS